MVELPNVQLNSFSSMNTGQRRLWFTPKVFQPQQNLVDPKGLRSGWQSDGHAKTNRDLLFFDVMLEDLVARGIVDADLVFSTGHSNGGIHLQLAC